MQVNSVSGVSFQAHIPSRLYNKMSMDAALRKSFPYDMFVKQVENVKNWGYASSCIMENLGLHSSFEGLSLVNSYLAPFKKAALPKKDSLLDTFLSLTENDIVKAQNSLKI